MSNKKCRASNPATCTYHGSPTLDTLVAKKDIDGYLYHREQLDANADQSQEQTTVLPAKTVDPLERRATDQLDTKGEIIDRADANAIYEIYKGLQSVRCASPSYVHRAAREAVQKIWQEPRMPSLRFAHNKPLAYPWSPKAREMFFTGKGGGKLVLEHVKPISLLRDEIFEAVSKPDCTPETIYQMLTEEHKKMSFTVITKAEDTILGKKFKNTMASGKSEYARYEQALNLTEKDFLSVTTDPKYKAWAEKQEQIKKAEKERQKEARLAKKLATNNALKGNTVPLAS